jgi:lantibiotic biosynthesis protein
VHRVLNVSSTPSHRLVPSPFLVVRAATLPLDELHRWSEGLAAPAAAATGDAGALATAIAADRERLRARLRALVDRPAIRDALHVASASLVERLAKWRERPESKDGAKIEHAVVRYVARMAGRATPFGLFASFSVGRVGDRTDLALRGEGRRHARLDMEYLVALAEALEKDPAIRARATFRPSAALYESAGRLHYPALVAGDGARRYQLVAIERDEALDRTLAAARAGATREQLARALAPGDDEVADARAYIDDLIDARVLESTLTVPLTGDDPLVALTRSLRELGDGAPAAAAAALVHAQRALQELADAEMGTFAARSGAVTAALAGLPATVTSSHLLQVDMSRAAEATLSREDADAIAGGVLALHAFSAPEAGLASFTKRFVARYEDREVPLMEALDEEVGLGFTDPGLAAGDPTPLVDGLRLRAAQRVGGAAWSPRSRFLLGKLEEAWSTGAESIALAVEDLGALGLGLAPGMPDSIAAFVTILGETGPGGARRLLLHAYTGASAARPLGRLCHWDDTLADALRAHLREEEARRPEAVFAEIVHLPAGSRGANVIVRPLLREHEIAFCGRSGAAPDHVLTVADLVLAARGGRLVLMSRSLGREIIPRLSSAHNFASRQLGAYRFLAALQSQGTTSGAAWSWGPLASARALPRVELGRVILAPRQWTLDAQEIARLTGGTSAARFAEALRLRAARRLPRVVGLAEGDNVLPVDLDNSLSVDAFAATLKGNDAATLTELFHDAADFGVRGPDGGHANEVVVPFLRKAPEGEPIKRARAAPSPPTRAPRSCAPGSEWLFAKIYCARGSVDHVLATCVRPVVSQTLGSDADNWFFLRYADPEPHLRVRFHGAPAALLGRVLPLLERAVAPLLASGRVHRFELATYEREIERYGGAEGLQVCERIFGVDSEAALSVLERLAGRPEGRDRWALALYGMHRLLVDFGCDLGVRARLTESARRLFTAEMRVTDEGEHAIAARYRDARPFVEALLGDREDLLGTRAAFDARSGALAPMVASLRALGPRLRGTRDTLAPPLVHMWCNRMLRADARKHELVLNTFLSRHYASELARK